jgi:predicted permease
MFARLRVLLSGLFARSRAEADMAEELAFHLRARIDDLVARGLPLDEATRQARLEFGGIALHEDRCRDALGWRILDEIRADLIYGARGLVTHRAFTIVALLTLAFGIGANTVMFGVIDALLFRPPSGVADPQDVVRIYPEFRHPTGNTITLSSIVEFRALERHPLTGATLAGYYRGAQRLGDPDNPDSPTVRTMFVSAEYFPLLRIRPARGRFFTGDEQIDEAAAHVAVISDGLWRSQFAADPRAVGQTITIGGLRLRVVGITPPSFTGLDLDPPDIIWLPLALARNEALLGKYMTGTPHTSPLTYRWLSLIARLDPGAQRARISAEVASTLKEAEQSIHETLPDDQRSPFRVTHVTLASLASHFGPARQKESPVSLWFLAVTAIVLLVACANVTNLLLARAVNRRHEIGVRLALGASRWRIVRQLLVESLMLAGAAGAVGLVIAIACSGLVALLPLPPLGGLIDRRVLAFTAAASAAASVIFGVLPALWATEHGEQTLLKIAGPTASPGRSRLRTALLVAQLALSLVLLVAGGLFVRSLKQVERFAPGFDTTPVAVAFLDLHNHGYSADDARTFEQTLVARLKQFPEVADASVTSSVAFTQWGLVIVGIPDTPVGKSSPIVDSVTTNQVGPAFFRTLDVPLLKGRVFTAADGAGAPDVAVISQSMAHKYWPGGDALGRCVKFPVSANTCTTVVGIVGNLRYQSATEEDRPVLYRPSAQMPAGAPYASLLVRANGPLGQTVATVRSVIKTMDPKLARVDVEPFEQSMDRIVTPWRIVTMLTGTFGVLAFLLAAVGLAGLMMFLVAQRTRELGVRLALGAQPRDVVRLVVQDGIRLTVIGLALGIAAAVATSRLLMSRLYQVSPLDPVSYAGAVLLLLVVAILATYIPARRAGRVDPAITLRAE